MRFKLTDKERCVLGWDDPGILRENPEVAAVVKKCDGATDLDEEDVVLLKDYINDLATFGADPGDTAAAKRLRRKVCPIAASNHLTVSGACAICGSRCSALGYCQHCDRPI